MKLAQAISRSMIMRNEFHNGLQPAVEAGTIKQTAIDNLITNYQTN